ncbi:caspase-7-like [Glandiceps talaboti]
MADLEDVMAELDVKDTPKSVNEDGGDNADDMGSKVELTKEVNNNELQALHDDLADETDARVSGNKDGTATHDILSKCLEDQYDMSHPKRGYAIIINNKEFEPGTRMGTRNGTDVDAQRLADSFTKLGFEIKMYKDMTIRKMKAIMQIQACDDHTDKDCIAVAILSHGDEDEVAATDGYIPTKELIEQLRGDKCKTLIGKPKLFFIQACRGQKYDEGAVLHNGKDETDAAPRIQRIPLEADFLICYSTVPGYYSWRNVGNGSWFIQSLCDVIDNHGDTMDVLRMMTRVCRKVAYKFESNTGDDTSSEKKQIPCIETRLTKDLYFTAKPPEQQKRRVTTI